MSYEEELEYLRREFKKSEDKFHEAEREGWHTDANIYEDNMENLGYQIHIHEQAAKADEHEAKAKAFDAIDEQYEEIMKEVRNRKFKVTGDLTRIGLVVEKVIKDYESGELDD